LQSQNVLPEGEAACRHACMAAALSRRQWPHESVCQTTKMLGTLYGVWKCLEGGGVFTPARAWNTHMPGVRMSAAASRTGRPVTDPPRPVQCRVESTIVATNNRGSGEAIGTSPAR